MLFAAHMLQPKSLEPCPANRVLKIEVSPSKQNLSWLIACTQGVLLELEVRSNRETKHVLVCMLSFALPDSPWNTQHPNTPFVSAQNATGSMNNAHACVYETNKHTHTHTTRARTHTHTHAPNASDWKKRKMAPSLWTLCSWPAQPRSLIVSRFLANHVVSPFSLPPFGTCAPFV